MHRSAAAVGAEPSALSSTTLCLASSICMLGGALALGLGALALGCWAVLVGCVMYGGCAFLFSYVVYLLACACACTASAAAAACSLRPAVTPACAGAGCSSSSSASTAAPPPGHDTTSVACLQQSPMRQFTIYSRRCSGGRTCQCQLQLPACVRADDERGAGWRAPSTSSTAGAGGASERKSRTQDAGRAS